MASKKEGKISAAVADKISSAMAYYLDSEQDEGAKAPSAPVRSSEQQSAKAASTKPAPASKPKQTKAPAPKSTPSAPASAPAAPTPSPRQQPSPAAPSPRTAPVPAHMLNAAAPSPSDSYLGMPSYLRKQRDPTHTKSRYSYSNPPSSAASGPLSPDKTEIAGSRLYARAKQQQRSLKDKQSKKPYKCTFVPSFETSAKKRGSTDRKAGQFKRGMTETASGQEVRQGKVPYVMSPC